MAIDYLELAREARNFREKGLSGIAASYVPKLCDAIEAQAAEIERLNHLASTARRFICSDCSRMPGVALTCARCLTLRDMVTP